MVRLLKSGFWVDCWSFRCDINIKRKEVGGVVWVIVGYFGWEVGSKVVILCKIFHGYFSLVFKSVSKKTRLGGYIKIYYMAWFLVAPPPYIVVQKKYL